MLNSLDLLIIVVMALAAVSALALVLLFAAKNPRVKQVCFYIVAAMGVYIGTVGYRINWPGFTSQVALAVVLALGSVGAVVLERLSKGDEKKQRIARILAAAALIAGMCNAFLI